MILNLSFEDAPQTLLFWDASHRCHESWSHLKCLVERNKFWGYSSMPCVEKVNCVEVWWWMALLILLFCCFFQPTWKKKPRDSRQNQTCKLTTSDVHEFYNKQTKLRVFPLDIRTQTHHKRASNGHCGERCTGLPMEKRYDNASPVDSPSTAASQLVAAALPHEAEIRAQEQLLIT